jgi:hypothetical protein
VTESSILAKGFRPRDRFLREATELQQEQEGWVICEQFMAASHALPEGKGEEVPRMN